MNARNIPTIFALTFALACEQVPDTDIGETGTEDTATVGDSSSDSDTGSDTGSPADVGSLADVPPEARVPSYCATFPERCSIAAPCPDRKVLDDGSVIGGCFPVDTYVCCNSEVGCWAVHWAADCVDGGLYWSDCDAGESAIDPESGKAIIICHD